MLVEITSHELLARRATIEEGLPGAHLGLQVGRYFAGLASVASVGPGAPRVTHSLRDPHLCLRQWRQPVGHAQFLRGTPRDERAIFAVGRAENAFVDRLFWLHGRMLGSKTHELHQQCAGSSVPPITSKKPLARQSETLRQSMSSREGATLFGREPS